MTDQMDISTKQKIIRGTSASLRRNFYKISDIAMFANVHPETVRRWETATGEKQLVPDGRTIGNQRLYSVHRPEIQALRRLWENRTGGRDKLTPRPRTPAHSTVPEPEPAPQESDRPVIREKTAVWPGSD